MFDVAPCLMTFFELIEKLEFWNDRFFHLRDLSGHTYIKTFFDLLYFKPNTNITLIITAVLEI